MQGPHGLVSFEEEKSYVDHNEATAAFEEALNRRRKTWVYDWMIPLIDGEVGDLESAKKAIDFRSHMSIHKIRAKLQDLQLKMVRLVFILFVHMVASSLGPAFSQLGPL
jgi:hypothetical protein